MCHFATKTLEVISLSLLITILFTCQTEIDQKLNIKAIAKNNNAEYYSGDFLIQTVNESNVLISLLNKENNKRANNMFYIQGVLNFKNKLKGINEGELVFLKNQLFLKVRNIEYTFSLKGSPPEKELSSLNAEQYVGFGISKMRGAWTIKPNLMHIMNINYIHQKPKGISKRVTDDDCTSGGEGATDCSIDEFPDIGCSVSCADGYYACCDTSNTTCTCKEDQSIAPPN